MSTGVRLCKSWCMNSRFMAREIRFVGAPGAKQMKGQMTRDQTLRGICVVTLASNVPGPVAASALQRLGATINKIEPPTGDPLSHLCPHWYRDLSRGQRVIRLNLKAKSDRERLTEFLDKADVLLTSNRPTSLRRMALDWKSLHRLFPQLCHVAIVGCPHPHANTPGHDLTYQARVGLTVPPQMPVTLLADLATAERVISEVLALLWNRRRLERGLKTTVAIQHVAHDFSAPARYGVTLSNGVLGGGTARYKFYKAKSGWIAVAALEQQFWEKLLLELDLSDGSFVALGAVFKQRTDTEWEAWAHERALPIVSARAATVRERTRF